MIRPPAVVLTRLFYTEHSGSRPAIVAILKHLQIRRQRNGNQSHIQLHIGARILHVHWAARAIYRRAQSKFMQDPTNCCESGIPWRKLRPVLNWNLLFFQVRSDAFRPRTTAAAAAATCGDTASDIITNLVDKSGRNSWIRQERIYCLASIKTRGYLLFSLDKNRHRSWIEIFRPNPGQFLMYLLLFRVQIKSPLNSR